MTKGIWTTKEEKKWVKGTSFGILEVTKKWVMELQQS